MGVLVEVALVPTARALPEIQILVIHSVAVVAALIVQSLLTEAAAQAARAW
jgi:hypothetical protein